ncbi:MAG: hypothetical protein H6599_02440 [Flavobacteriales bacterium]|nr:hypothetical protein [Flavobacteriales bacterium]MCB9188120.1 hypothetical protein [Flavobacteriales bacterium]
MKTTKTYKFDFKRALAMSAMSFVFLFVLIVLTLILNEGGFTKSDLLFFGIWCLPPIMGLTLSLNYYLNSKNVTIYFTNESTKIEDNGYSTELQNAEIDRVIITSCSTHLLFIPWTHFEYYALFQGDKKITFNNFSLDQSDFFGDNLTRHINRDLIEYKRTWYPWMKK